MTQWRKIHTKINQSDDFNDMPDDFTRLTWIMLSTYADSAGRYVDNMNLVRSTLYPMRDDVTNDMISAALDWFEQRGMITRYQAAGRNYFYIPSFTNYQDTRKSAPSTIPKPTPETVRTYSGLTPDLLRTNSSTEENRIEEKRVEGEENQNKPATTTFSDFETASLRQQFDELPEEARLLELYTEVTDLTYVNTGNREDFYGKMRQIEALYQTREKMLEDMKRQYTKWKNTRTKAGKFYSILGIGWLDWVIEDRK